MLRPGDFTISPSGFVCPVHLIVSGTSPSDRVGTTGVEPQLSLVCFFFPFLSFSAFFQSHTIIFSFLICFRWFLAPPSRALEQPALFETHTRRWRLSTSGIWMTAGSSPSRQGFAQGER